MASYPSYRPPAQNAGMRKHIRAVAELQQSGIGSTLFLNLGLACYPRLPVASSGRHCPTQGRQDTGE